MRKRYLQLLPIQARCAGISQIAKRYENGMAIMVMKFIQKYAWAFCLGVALSIFGIDFTMLKFYIIVVPVVLLVNWKESI